MSVNYHFFGKDCIIERDILDRANLQIALKRQNFIASQVLFLNQIHSNLVEIIDSPDKIYSNQNLPKGDALVTNLPNLIVGVITADCSPILLFDEDKKIIAAAHAGWRGAKSGIIAETIKAMKSLGANNISAIIGPMIQQKSYEVSQEFFDEFVLEDKNNERFFTKGVSVEKYQFDLPSFVEKKLGEAGVGNVKNLGIDTYENEEDFFSFRRSTHHGEKDCGRNVSVVGM